PLPVAWLLFQWGHARERAGDRAAARALYRAAAARLPQYVELAVHLADLEVRGGELGSAIARLEPLTGTGHPVALALLAKLVRARGDGERYAAPGVRATASRAALAALHPAAFSDGRHHRFAAAEAIGSMPSGR